MRTIFIAFLLAIALVGRAQQPEEPCKSVTYDIVGGQYDDIMTKAQETQTVILAKVGMRQPSASALGSLASWAIDNGFEAELKEDAHWGDGTTKILEVTLNGSALTKRAVIAFADKVMVAQQQLAPDACADTFVLRLSAP